jgi:hypothetical protein
LYFGCRTRTDVVACTSSGIRSRGGLNIATGAQVQLSGSSFSTFAVLFDPANSRTTNALTINGTLSTSASIYRARASTVTVGSSGQLSVNGGLLRLGGGLTVADGGGVSVFASGLPSQLGPPHTALSY